MERPNMQVAVIMRRERLASRWQPWRWVLDDVVPHEAAFGTQPRLLVRGEEGERWLHPGFTVELFRDDADGYYLNATSPAPCWFVLWRMQDDPALSPEPIARPVVVSLSYHDAGRWLDAQETVEQVPAPPRVVQWMDEFVQAHHVLEPKQRRRPQSFRALQDRFGQPASVSTGRDERDRGDGHE